MAQIYNTLISPDGIPVEAKVEIKLVASTSHPDSGGFVPGSKIEVLGRWSSETDNAGYWTVNLIPNVEISPAGTYYIVTERFNPGQRVNQMFVRVPVAATPVFWVGDIFIIPPESLDMGLRADQVSVIPIGGILSDNVQDALVELRQDIVSGSGDANFVHIQAAPSSSWVVTHGLGKYPAVTVVDSAGTEVVGSVDYVSLSQVIISFSGGFSGKAFFN